MSVWAMPLPLLSRLSWLVDVLFENKIATTFLVVAWMLFTCCLFYTLGAFHMQFMTFGPSPHTTFMGMVIDTWVKWAALACFSFLNTAMNEFLDSALAPWFTNTIQDHKTKYLPYPKMTCLAIVQLFTLYTHVMGVFGIFLFFSQVDFLLIRLAADLIVSHYVTIRFMEPKRVDPVMYSRDREDGWCGEAGMSIAESGPEGDQLLSPKPTVGAVGPDV